MLSVPLVNAEHLDQGLPHSELRVIDAAPQILERGSVQWIAAEDVTTPH